MSSPILSLGCCVWQSYVGKRHCCSPAHLLTVSSMARSASPDENIMKPGVVIMTPENSTGEDWEVESPQLAKAEHKALCSQ